jgi:PncC family amidohydrolase
VTDKPLEVQVGELLKQRDWMFSAAESCTGGLLMHRLTNVAGSSSYLCGGVVVYSYDAKERLIGVRRQTLETCGAVSPETAEEMVRGVLGVLGGDIAISITGIAGPGGGLPEKPVGLTYIGIYAPALGLLRIDRHIWSGDRVAVKTASAEEAMRKVIAALC